jgi:hydroxypyruvate isomerase
MPHSQDRCLHRYRYRYSVCIETLFPFTVPYEERVRVTASLGFNAYEFWYLDLKRAERGWVPRDSAEYIELLHGLNQELGLRIVCFAVNSPKGDHGGHLLDEMGYSSHYGLEYYPLGDPEGSLKETLKFISV